MAEKDFIDGLLNHDFKQAERSRCKEIPNYVFKYVPLGLSTKEDEQKISTIANDSLWLSPSSSYNDPYEFKGLYLDEDQFKKLGYNNKFIESLNSLYQLLTGDFVSCCFTTNDFTSMPMWAYYANYSKGLCLKYSVQDKSHLYKIIYEDCPHDTSGMFFNLIHAIAKGIYGKEEQVTAHILEMRPLIKHSSWKHENELRVIQRGNGDKGRYELASTFGLKLSKIYLGLEIDKSTANKLIEILQSKGIAVSQLRTNKRSFFAKEEIEYNPQHLNNSL